MICKELFFTSEFLYAFYFRYLKQNFHYTGRCAPVIRIATTTYTIVYEV